MRILYYTSGITGSGRVIIGISIGNALKRKGIVPDFTILCYSEFAFLANDFKHIKIKVENEIELSKENYKSSVLYNTIMEIKPDVLIVDHIWHTLHQFIDKLPFKKIYLATQVDNSFFTVPLKNQKLIFIPEDYNYIFSIEPFKSSIKMTPLNPFIIRNKNEILTKKDALLKLNLSSDKKNCLFAFNGHPGDFERIKKMYSYLEDVGYHMVYTTNYKSGIFPVVDYFNAFDLIICGAGYNAFWEASYFKKEAIVVPVPTKFENQQRRIDECIDYKFEENGSDQLVDIILSL